LGVGADARVTNDSNCHPGSEARKPTGEPGSEVGVAIEEVVGLVGGLVDWKFLVFEFFFRFFEKVVRERNEGKKTSEASFRPLANAEEKQKKKIHSLPVEMMTAMMRP